MSRWASEISLFKREIDRRWKQHKSIWDEHEHEQNKHRNIDQLNFPFASIPVIAIARPRPDQIFHSISKALNSRSWSHPQK